MLSDRINNPKVIVLYHRDNTVTNILVYLFIYILSFTSVIIVYQSKVIVSFNFGMFHYHHQTFLFTLIFPSKTWKIYFRRNITNNISSLVGNYYWVLLYFCWLKYSIQTLLLRQPSRTYFYYSGINLPPLCSNTALTVWLTLIFPNVILISIVMNVFNQPNIRCSETPPLLAVNNENACSVLVSDFRRHSLCLGRKHFPRKASAELPGSIIAVAILALLTRPNEAVGR